MSNETISNLDLRAIYLETEAGDIYGLFSEYRLKDAVLPEGLIAYGVRHSDDDDSVPSTIEPSVTVNYFGLLIVDRPLDFRGKDHIDITEWGFDEDEELSDSLKQYLDE
ncbi:LPD28 domain-containing protein [Alistipes sp.]|uniref:LPD28 domain-containing protein n=1 Tax=Alistipes sp. TaxID=1872444 RepID=UPI003AF5ED29